MAKKRGAGAAVDMTAAEEESLASAFAAVRTDPPTAEYVALRNAFVVRWLPFALWVVKRRRPSELAGDAADDCLQAGAVGLVEAADRFDPGRGLRFSTFAERYVWGEVAACVALARLIYVPPRTTKQGPGPYAAEREAALTFGRGAGDEWAVSRVGARPPRHDPDPDRVERAERLARGFANETAAAGKAAQLIRWRDSKRRQALRRKLHQPPAERNQSA